MTPPGPDAPGPADDVPRLESGLPDWPAIRQAAVDVARRDGKPAAATWAGVTERTIRAWVQDAEQRVAEPAHLPAPSLAIEHKARSAAAVLAEKRANLAADMVDTALELVADVHRPYVKTWQANDGRVISRVVEPSPGDKRHTAQALASVVNSLQLISGQATHRVDVIDARAVGEARSMVERVLEAAAVQGVTVDLVEGVVVDEGPPS